MGAGVPIGDPVPTDEPTGLSIEVAVADNDVNSFRETSQNFFQFFPSHEMPYFIGVEDDFIKPQEKVLASDTDDWFFLAFQREIFKTLYNKDIIYIYRLI